MMEEGDTLSYYTTDNGMIFIKKDTTLYEGFDFEEELIRERVQTYVKSVKMMDRSEFDEWEFEYPEEQFAHLDEKPLSEYEMQELRRQFMDDIAHREQNRKAQRSKGV